MNIDTRWVVLAALAAGAAAGAAVAMQTRRRQHRTARDLDHATDLKSWENEGGNLPPASVAATHA